jgi:hypothetical protein
VRSSDQHRRERRANTAERERPPASLIDRLVLTFLRENTDSSPHGPSAVAKALGRSGGAIRNCLVRLARAKQVREVSEHPRSYSLAA